MTLRRIGHLAIAAALAAVAVLVVVEIQRGAFSDGALAVPDPCHRTVDVATDATGRSQPDMPRWNVGGYANNAVQRMAVTVR